MRFGRGVDRAKGMSSNRGLGGVLGELWARMEKSIELDAPSGGKTEMLQRINAPERMKTAAGDDQREYGRDQQEQGPGWSEEGSPGQKDRVNPARKKAGGAKKNRDIG